MKRYLSLILAVITVITAFPACFSLPAVATTEAPTTYTQKESGEFVYHYTGTSFADINTYINDNASEGKNLSQYSKVYILISNKVSISADTKFATGTAKDCATQFIITGNVTVTNTENTAISDSEGTLEQKAYAYYNSEDKTASACLVTPDADAKFFLLAAKLELDYLWIDYTSTNFLWYAGFCDFTIGSSVKAGYAATATKNYPIVIEGGRWLRTDESNPPTVGFSRTTPKITQNINILSGKYQYISTKIRHTSSFTTVKDSTINIRVENVELMARVEAGNTTAVVANENVSNCSYNVTYVNTTFRGNFAVFCGREISSSSTSAKKESYTVKGLTANVEFENCNFNAVNSGEYALFSIYTPASSATFKPVFTDSVYVNVTIDDATAETLKGKTNSFGYISATDAKVDTSFSTQTGVSSNDEWSYLQINYNSSVIDAPAGFDNYTVIKEGATRSYNKDGNPIIYVDYGKGNSTNSGLTAATAVKSSNEAVSVIEKLIESDSSVNGATIEILDDYGQYHYLMNSASAIDTEKLRGFTEAIYFVGADRQVNGRRLTTSQPSNIRSYTDLIFSNITFKATGGTKYVYAGYKDLIFDASCIYTPTESNGCKMNIISGYNSADKYTGSFEQTIDAKASGMYFASVYLGSTAGDDLSKDVNTSCTGKVNVSLNENNIYGEGTLRIDCVGFDVTLDVPSSVNITAPNLFSGDVAFSVKQYANGLGLRATKDIVADMATKLGVVEFGFLAKASDSDAALEYISGTNANGVAKSVAYDAEDNITAFVYDGEEECATFSAPIVFNTATNAQIFTFGKTNIDFKPYAVIKLADGTEKAIYADVKANNIYSVAEAAGDGVGQSIVQAVDNALAAAE